MTKFYDAVYSFERVRGYQFVKLYISMFEKWLESPQWLLAVSKPEVRMRVTSAWGQDTSEAILTTKYGKRAAQHTLSGMKSKGPGENNLKATSANFSATSVRLTAGPLESYSGNVSNQDTAPFQNRNHD